MSIYATTARFDATRPMTDDEMRRVAPSIFATTAHESRSERFRAIPTIDVLNGLRNEGFFPVAVKQSVARDESRREFTKHLIRMRRFDNVEAYKVGDTVCEVLMKNANDGTSIYDLMAGLFRIRCMNSLVAAVSTLSACKVRHTGDVAHKVIEGTFTVLEESQKALAAPADWSRIELPRDARAALAEAAHVLRFGDCEGVVTTPIKPDQLLRVRRHDDTGNDLWTTFNVVQENTLRGGLSAMGLDANNRRRRTTTREVKGIDQDVKLNKALWVLGERMAGMLRSQAA